MDRLVATFVPFIREVVASGHSKEAYDFVTEFVNAFPHLRGEVFQTLFPDSDHT